MKTPLCYVASMHSPAWDRAQFRRVLRRLLKETGLSPQDIAEMAEVSRPQVSRWMSGANRPGFDAIQRLARAIMRDYPGERDLLADLMQAAGYPQGPAQPVAPVGAAQDGRNDSLARKWESFDEREQAIAIALIETLRRNRAEQEQVAEESA